MLIKKKTNDNNKLTETIIFTIYVVGEVVFCQPQIIYTHILGFVYGQFSFHILLFYLTILLEKYKIHFGCDDGLRTRCWCRLLVNIQNTLW